jgi:uncharacterized protein (DUF433 family)
MTIQELRTQLLTLSPIERSDIIQFLTSSIETPWQGVNKTPGLMGGEACIRDTRIPVWLLVSYRRLGLSEAKLLENYPSLSATDLVNAWNYAQSYSDEIDRAIAEQDKDE